MLLSNNPDQSDVHIICHLAQCFFHPVIIPWCFRQNRLYCNQDVPFSDTSILLIPTWMRLAFLDASHTCTCMIVKVYHDIRVSSRYAHPSEARWGFQNVRNGFYNTDTNAVFTTKGREELPGLKHLLCGLISSLKHLLCILGSRNFIRMYANQIRFWICFNVVKSPYYRSITKTLESPMSPSPMCWCRQRYRL